MTDKALQAGDVVIRHGVRYVIAHLHNADGRPSLVVEGSIAHQIERPEDFKKEPSRA